MNAAIRASRPVVRLTLRKSRTQNGKTKWIWIIRPMVYVGERAAENPGWSAVWLDAAGIVGALCIWGFFVVRAVGASPLVPLKDPTLHEALKHKNYV